MKQFRIGSTHTVCECSGVDSGKEVTVIPWFYWREANDGTYKSPDPKRECAVAYRDGRRGFMFKDRLR